jgi:hypothetical protein
MTTAATFALQASTSKITCHRRTTVATTIKAAEATIWALRTNAKDYPSLSSTMTSIQGTIALTAGVSSDPSTTEPNTIRGPLMEQASTEK